ncbi:ABC transporter permease [Gordonia sp. ABKF26]|uniref:ABC transporter permease n=1 Tax=Gordonia sp. ABKF26 TaxID=3238687 RepID=UPI0034E5585D
MITETDEPAHYRRRGLGWTRSLRRAWGPVDAVGRQFHFVWMALSGIGHALRMHRRRTAEIFTDLAWGNGRALIVGGGVAPVLALMGVVSGAMIGIIGFEVLDMLGVGPLAGAMSAIANPRELAPLIAAVGFAAQAGCRITAEVGAMRISEEIDALEAQAIDPVPYVVSTRVIASVLTVIPAYLIALALGFATTRLTVTAVQGQPTGAYQHYFDMFVEPLDLAYSLVKVAVFVIVVTLVHAYQGFYASGGPEGVGVASGRAIRASLVAITVCDMVLTLLMWGLESSIDFAG